MCASKAYLYYHINFDVYNILHQIIHRQFSYSAMEAGEICRRAGYHLWHIGSYDEWHQLYSMTEGLFLLFDIIPVGLLCYHQVLR